MSCFRLLLLRASPVKPPRSPVMPSMCCSVFVSVNTESLNALTLSVVKTCTMSRCHARHIKEDFIKRPVTEQFQNSDPALSGQSAIYADHP